MSVSIVFARGLSAELGRRGIDPSAALLGAGISDDRLADLRSRLSFEEANTLFGIAAELTHEPGLGLFLGNSSPLHMLQLVGQMMMSERSLQSAIETLRRFSNLLADGLLWNVALEAGIACVSFSPPDEFGRASRCVTDFAMAMLARVSRHFMGPNGALSFVRLRHAAPSYSSLYGTMFGCPVYFDQPVNAVAIPHVHFRRAQAHADEIVRHTAERAALRLLHQHRETMGLAHRVRTILRFETNFADFEPTRVARQVGTGHRTLRRRLAEENTSIKQLADEARCWIACRRLRLHKPNIKEIAAELGFADSPSFHRAFRRWMGMTPAAYAGTRSVSARRGLPGRVDRR